MNKNAEYETDPVSNMSDSIIISLWELCQTSWKAFIMLDFVVYMKSYINRCVKKEKESLREKLKTCSLSRLAPADWPWLWLLG